MQIFTEFTSAERQAFNEMYDWVMAAGEQRCLVSGAGKLDLATQLLAQIPKNVSSEWKVKAVGVVLGEALRQTLEGRLQWVVVKDDAGKSFALQWRHTEVLLYPLTALWSRFEADAPIDLKTIYREYVSALPFVTR